MTKPKRFSQIPDDEYLSGRLLAFSSHLDEAIRSLIDMATDKPGAERISNELQDHFDLVAGALNTVIVQDIKRRGKIEFSNAMKRMTKNRTDEEIRSLRDELQASGTKKHKIVKEIMSATGFKKSKIDSALKG